MARNTVSRAMHDVGLAAWFGGTLANAVALNPAAAEAGLSSRTGAVANVGWDRWTPVNAGAIGAHVIGAVGMTLANRSRIVGQEGGHLDARVNRAGSGIAAEPRGQLGGNSGRIKGQQGVGEMAVVKTIVTAAALGVTAYSRVLGKKVSKRTDVPAASGTEPTASTPDDVAAAQKQLKALQWAIPALTGALLVISAYAGEQQRASEVHKGVLQRITPGA